MSIVIYTYHDPYKIDQEPYWDEIKNCPYFCSAQTLVNGLRSHYKKKFDGGRVSTVKILTDSLYVDWASTAWIVKQHTDIDNIINSGFSTDLSESERINIGRAFLFNRDDVFTSIRTMFELNVDPSAILKNKLTKEQRFILGIYQKILASEMKKDFYLARSLAEEEIDEGLRRAMTAKQEDYDFSDVNLDTIVIHGVHQFNPIMLRAIDELRKYKNVILLFNYQKQYKNVYQTWVDIYSAFDCKIIDCDRNEFLATDSSTVSYKGNVLADQLGKLVNGQRRAITVGDPYEIIEFDNMTEFAGYVADIFEEAERKDPQKPMHHMREQIYAANSSANDILKIYFPEQFGERQFLNYPIGHFLLAIANMWDPEKNEILISDINDVRECLGANILSEDVPGQLVSIFGKIQALFDGCVSIKQMRKRLKSLKKNMKYITDSLEQEYVSHISYYAVTIDDNQVVREYMRLVESGFKPQNVVHLGKRGGGHGFLKDEIDGMSNIDWFKQEYSEENWIDLVDNAKKEASEKAMDVFVRRSNIRGAREEMERTLSARAANADYFGISQEGLEELKETQAVILNAIKRPRLVLESAAFVWMVKTENE